MKIGILGKKLGMTQIFSEEGQFICVTVIEAGPCSVLRVLENKIALGFGLKKTKKNALVREMEYTIDGEISVGGNITVDVFKEKDFVDISGTSKGKGFQGGVKRWHWRGGPDSHGSMHHRRVGSIGASSYPSRVIKGQRMPGRMGNERKTIQNLEVLKIYKDKNIMLVRGSIPGANGGYLEIRSAKKKPIVRVKEVAKKEEK